MLKNFVRILGGDPHKREVQQLSVLVEQINALEAEYEKLTDEALLARTDEFKQRLEKGETLDDLRVEAFAAVREASKRTIGLRHYDVQMIGGMTLHAGKIAEMRTGEGKTLVATLSVYLNALTGKGVHVVTVNDYLARRDARWMTPVYQALGLSVGVLQAADRTENGSKAFVVDLEKAAPREDQNQMRMVDRSEAYRADIVYGTNSEFGFDYLRDNLTNRLEDRVQRGHYYAIVDEVDNILIDEARTPLIISGPASDETEYYVRMAALVRQLLPEDYEINERERQVSLTEVGESHVEELLDMSLRDPERPEDITPEQARVLGYLEQSLRAQFLYKRNKDYLVQGGKVLIVDEFTGRLMPGRRWSEGLHQAVEAKEGVKIEPENVTYATITIQNYFRMYEKLAGMTGTALTEAEEFHKIYKLEVLPIPTNLEYVALLNDSPLVSVEGRDEQNYRYTYYAKKDDSQRTPVFWKRKDYPDVIYRKEEAKLRAMTTEIIRTQVVGRPQLVGTTSVEHSELLSDRLQAEPVRRLAQVLIIRDAWLKKFNQLAERVIPELQFMNKPLDELNTGELRQVARTLGFNNLTPDDPDNLKRLMEVLNLEAEYSERLVKILQGGVPHQVLNARKHDEEALIIARAGAFGAVTIATNMAGRGVDIRLGGDLSDEILQDLMRVLRKAGYEDPYNMNNEERLAAVRKIAPEEYALYEESVKGFIQYMEDMENVRALGGLHVVGSERHEARRIDNQLRGRAARQGDPGSSRFYLSLEDDLMRLFGGDQMENMMQRMSIDDNMPIELGLIGRLVEQAQERVEGNNFDIRKHLLEYDDVLNSQRKRIYAERDRAFLKDDLSEDIGDILHTELEKRIPEALQDEEGPWKLLAYLEEIQPSMNFEHEGVRIPSYPIRLLLQQVRRMLPADGGDSQQLKEALLELASRTLKAEQEHILRSTRTLLDRSEEALEATRNERLDALDAFFDGLGDLDENGQARRPQDLTDEMSNLVRMPVRLTNEQMRRLTEGDKQLKETIRQQVDVNLTALAFVRVVGSLERRLDESLNLRPAQLTGAGWNEAAGLVLDAVEDTLTRRDERLLGTQGQIAQNIDAIFARTPELSLDDYALVDIIMGMSQGQKITIDPRSHRRGWRKVVLLNYVYSAARSIAEQPVKDVSDQVLEHLENALASLQKVWGVAEFERLTSLNATLGMLDERVQSVFRERLGAEKFDALAAQPLAEYDPQARADISALLGWRVQNEINRQILLSIISELWVDYLTKVEALRISIGLEAYAQRDPLVQYKGRASEMFQELLVDIRRGVISRMFLVQPRRAAAAQVDNRAETEEPAAVTGLAGQPETEQERAKKKRRRH
jgi:preprotein translocase subunit SecA